MTLPKFRNVGAIVIMWLAALSSAWAMTHTQKDTAVGAATGGVAGAVVAGPVGAVVGAVGGGVVGHKIGERHSAHRVKTTNARRSPSVRSNRSRTTG